MTGSRTIFRQAIDGVILVGVWLVALVAPLFLAPSKGDIITQSIWLGLSFVVLVVVYIGVNLRKILMRETINIGDLIAKVVAPILIFVGSFAPFFV